ncbi:hypothetical protein [Alicyclobacillus sp. ALC3]|uniref:hypothetical protein n=1 Tax=Alicyclobacillus sp. ALC3 TaxID=2796143 RepID=UPI002378B8E0|nr:hypothetical protein [Alicyclobacillus sp. ALC3]WDL99070.1 hypothetical protein JC200_10700 [Alicyclobacillus sp. ALC3]
MLNNYYESQRLLQQRKVEVERINRTQWMYEASAVEVGTNRKRARTLRRLTPRFGRA